MPVPVVADGHLLLASDDGVTKVLRPGPSFEIFAENRLGERIHSSPAIADGAIYFRTAGHLVRIAEGCGGSE